jgi:DNA polymerase-3 subunit alpha
VKERIEHGLYQDIIDFVLRVDKKVLNKKTLESLIKAGAFDSFEQNRAKLYNAVSELLILNNAVDESQFSLFDEFEETKIGSFKLHECSIWSIKELLYYEKLALGFYYSGSLFDEYKDLISQIGLNQLNYYTVDNDEVINSISLKDKSKNIATVAGIITSIGSRPLKKGGKLYFINLEDDVGNFEFIIYDNEYDTYKDHLFIDNFIAVDGELIHDTYRQQVKITAKKIYNINQLLKNKVKKIKIKINQHISIDELQSYIFESNNKKDEYVEIIFLYSNDLFECLLKPKDEFQFILNIDNITKLKKTLGIIDFKIFS